MDAELRTVLAVSLADFDQLESQLAELPLATLENLHGALLKGPGAMIAFCTRGACHRELLRNVAACGLARIVEIKARKAMKAEGEGL